MWFFVAGMREPVMQILLIEPYDTGSHAAWMRGYQRHSAHDVTILSLPGQFWQWRMQGGAVTLARQFLAGDYQPDVLVASDMLNLATFLALTRTRTAAVPAALYFHENQLTYPMGPRQRKEVHFQLGFMNYASAMAADAVLFNSRYHQTAFLDALPRLLKHFPDYTELDSVALLRDRSSVLPLGLALQRFDAHRTSRETGRPPLIVWNHRWEHDKNPRPFLNALARLAGEGVDFEVALTGENFRQDPSRI
jgi:glycosyltransferase involved in cell wall biosynthesis